MPTEEDYQFSRNIFTEAGEASAKLNASKEGVDWEGLSAEEREMRMRDALVPMAKTANQIIDQAGSDEKGERMKAVLKGIKRTFQDVESDDMKEAA